MSETLGELLSKQYLAEGKPVRPSTRIHVYCDVDGVLADFNGAIVKWYNLPNPDAVVKFLARSENWHQVTKDHPHLFNELAVLPDARRLITGLFVLQSRKQIDLSFLTALPHEWQGNPQQLRRGREDKVRWMTRHFQQVDPDSVIVCESRKDKVHYSIQQHVTNQRAAILIDDYKKNVEDWQQIGSGIGVLHTSAPDSLSQVRQYLSTEGV